MKLAFFVSDYPVTSETFIVRQIAGMVDLGHDVTVIAGYVNKDVKDSLHGKVTVMPIRASLSARDHINIIAGLMWPGTNLSYRAIFHTAASAVKNKIFGTLSDIYHSRRRDLGNYDAIIAHFGPAGVRAMLLRDAGLLSGPIATVFHGMDMTDEVILKKYKYLYSELFKRTEILLPISDLWKDKLVEWGADLEKIKVHRMGVDLSTHEINRTSQPELTDYLEILSVGRFVEKKGLEYAISGVIKSGVKCKYTIVGYGPLEEQLRRAAAGNDNIHFVGKVDHAGVFRLLSKSNVFLLPSVTASNGDMEGIPVSIMEAMAADVLVLATRHSGIPELVEDGINGILVDERNSDQIAGALKEIASGKIDIPKLTKSARVKVENAYNNETLDNQLSDILRSISSG
jgi:colanic acid/amylovoran biosynthesis glycosyltransferase